MKENGSFSDMFGGLTPSVGVRRLVQAAFDLGLDPTGITSRAGTAARQEGRTKLGSFGRAEPYIDNLREIVDSEKWQRKRQKLLDKSRPR